MRILILVGELGDSIVENRMRPLSTSREVSEIMVVSRIHGPRIPRVKYYCGPKHIARHSWLAMMFDSLNALRLAVFRRPEVVIGYNLFPHGLISFLVARLTGNKFAAGLIGGPSELYWGRNIRGLDLTSSKLNIYGRMWMKLLKQSLFVITTGSFTNRFLVRQGLKSEKLCSMIHAPDPERIFRKAIPKKYDLISVGKLSSEKHFEVVLKITAQVKMRFPEIKTCIVGSGPLLSQMMKKAEELGIKNNVEFAGRQKDVSMYYNSSRVLVHTSEREGFPNVYLEAMQCGLPCVISNCGDINDIARDGINALVIQDYTDHEGFARAVIRLLENDELYSKLSDNAVATVQSISDADITRKWDLLLCSLASNKKPLETSSD